MKSDAASNDADIYLQGDAMQTESERRQYRRYRCVAEVQVSGLGGANAVDGHVEDLSVGGCLIRIANEVSFPKGETVEVSFRTKYTSFRALGLVQWQGAGGMLVGILFGRLSERGREELRELIAGLETVHVTSEG